MSQDIADMPGIEAAMERFAADEKSTAQTDTTPAKTPDTREQTPAAQATAEPSKAQHSDSQPNSDTRAAAEKPAAQSTGKPEAQPPEAAKPDAKTGVKPDAAAAKAEADKSRYAKSQERLTKTWEQVNADKTATVAERQKLETAWAEFRRQKAEFETIWHQGQQPQYKPDDFVAAAQQKKALADHQLAEAKRLETAGKFDQAEKLEKLAAKNEALSEDLKEHADNLVRNPPKGFAERTQQYESAKKAWTIEAAKAFPDLAKDGSEFQRTVAGHLNALAKSDPKLLAHPSVIYHVSRLAAAEAQAKAYQAEAARVAVLVKETESLRAKIKDLEALTTPAGGGSVAHIGGQPAEDDVNSLRQAAAENGSLFR